MKFSVADTTKGIIPTGTYEIMDMRFTLDAKAFEKALAAKGTTKTDVLKAMGLEVKNRSLISSWLSGLRQVHVADGLSMAKALDVKLEKLVRHVNYMYVAKEGQQSLATITIDPDSLADTMKMISEAESINPLEMELAKLDSEALRSLLLNAVRSGYELGVQSEEARNEDAMSLARQHIVEGNGQ